MDTLFLLLEAKAGRDTVRDLIARAVRNGDFAEAKALLAADERATEAYKAAVAAHQQNEHQQQEAV